MNRKDQAEMRQRLEEEYDLLTCGYDPAYPDRREPWIKCHAGDVLTREVALQQIRSHPDYSQDAKRRYIAEAYEKAQAEYREAVETQEREIAERVTKAERELFQTRYPRSATEEEKVAIRAARRAAYANVYSSYSSVSSGKDLHHAEEELERLLERAERTQDPELADAVYHVATEKGVRVGADAYLEARPEERKRWDRYVEARQETDSLDRTLGHAMGFGLMKPPELNSYSAAG